MAEISLFSPRKITPQNQRHLPDNHDASKRITYVQITLDEDEIAEAVRNYIRAQVPVREGEQLPVVLVAGRGENGHSATITLSVDPVAVVNATRPVDALATFNETAAAAARRNSEDEAEDQTEAPTSVGLPSFNGNPNPNRLPASVGEAAALEGVDTPDEDTPAQEEAVTETQEEPPQTEAPKKSSLFGTPAPAAQNLQQAAPASGPVEVPVTKGKSIFDNLR